MLGYSHPGSEGAAWDNCGGPGACQLGQLWQQMLQGTARLPQKTQNYLDFQTALHMTMGTWKDQNTAAASLQYHLMLVFKKVILLFFFQSVLTRENLKNGSWKKNKHTHNRTTQRHFWQISSQSFFYAYFLHNCVTTALIFETVLFFLTLF